MALAQHHLLGVSCVRIARVLSLLFSIVWPALALTRRLEFLSTPATSAAGLDAPAGLVAGSWVELFGVQPEAMNGLRVVVQGGLNARGRYTVMTTTGKMLSIKAEHLRRAADNTTDANVDGDVLSTRALAAEPLAEASGQPQQRCEAGAYAAQPWADNNVRHGFFHPDARDVGPERRNTSSRLTVYVQFSKAGSETVRGLLASGVGVEQTPDFCFMHSRGMRRGSGKNASLATATIVQGKYGLCGATEAHGRKCSYFTVLRDPIELMLSQYSYFCLGCREHGRHCNNTNMRVAASANATSPNATCPHMSLLDYAQIMGNSFVHEFSGAYSCAPCPSIAGGGSLPIGRSGKPYLCKPYVEACGPLRGPGASNVDGKEQPPSDETLLQRAKANLARDVLPVLLEDLDASKAGSNNNSGTVVAGLDLVARAFDLPGLLRRPVPHLDHGMGHTEGYVPMAEELEALRMFLSPDLTLYAYARQLSREAGALMGSWSW